MRVGLKPTFWNTASIAAFPGSTSATNDSIPRCAARAASCSSSRVPIPLPLPVVGDREGRLRRRALAQPHIVADRDDGLVVGPADHADERTSLVPVRLDERPHELLARPREAVEAQKTARGREAVEEGAEALHVRRGRRPEPERRSVTEDDVDPGNHPCIVTFRGSACDYTRVYTRRGMDHSIEGRDNARHDENDHRTRHSADRAAAGGRRTDRGRVLERRGGTLTGISARTAKAHSDVLRSKLGVARRRQIPAAYRLITGDDPYVPPLVRLPSPRSR